MKCLTLLCLPLLSLCAAVCATAQSTSANLSGVVDDTSGKVIVGAEIEILNELTFVHYSSKSNESGIYAVTALPPGQYRLQVSKPGFKTLIKPGVILNVESALALNITMPVEPHLRR